MIPASRARNLPLMLVPYRIVYGLVAALFLANLLATDYYGTVPLHTSLLITAAKLSLACLLIVLIAFSRLKPAVLWGVVLAWEALFVWYAWFSPATPFVLHEAHAMEPGSVLGERTAYHGKAAVLFAGLFLWFLSLGVVRSLQAGFLPAKPD